MTCQREDLERGLEPDDCYWIAHESVMRGRTEVDFEVDPAPDLAIEIEISRSVLNRIGIYAALRVPEVWRSDGERVRVNILGEDGQYHESERSLAFPFLPIAELERFLKLAGTISETQLLRTFRVWVRDQAARGWKPE